MRRLIQLISIYEYFFYRKTHIRWTFSISITKESNWSDDILYLHLVYSLFVYLRMQIKRNEPNVFRLNAFKRRPYSARLEIFDCVSGWLNIICFIWFFNIFSIVCYSRLWFECVFYFLKRLWYGQLLWVEFFIEIRPENFMRCQLFFYSYFNFL